MLPIREFFASRSSEIIVGVVAGVVGSVAYGTLGWCWARWVRTWDKRVERRKLLDEFAIDAMNFVNNMSHWLDGDQDKCFVLFPQGPNGVSKRIGPEVLTYVGKLQAQITDRLLGFTGLFGFSRRQHDRMMELYRRLGQVGAGVKYFGGPVRWDQESADRSYDVKYVRDAWDDLLPLIRHEKDHSNSEFLHTMRWRFRFLSFICPSFPAAKLPPRTDSKGVEVMECFGSIKLKRNTAA